METLKNSPANEVEDGKYIIIKIPRDSLQNLNDDLLYTLPGEKNLRKRVWIVLCIISLFMGVVIGSLIQPVISLHAPEKAVWKSSNLSIPDRK